MSSWMSTAQGIGSSTGGMSSGMNALNGVGGDQFSGMSAGGGDDMSAGMMAGLMGGGGGGGGMKALRTKGLESYKDMSRGDLGGLMNMTLGNQNGSQQNMQFNQQQQDRMRQQQYQNPYIQGLMGGF